MKMKGHTLTGRTPSAAKRASLLRRFYFYFYVLSFSRSRLKTLCVTEAAGADSTGWTEPVALLKPSAHCLHPPPPHAPLLSAKASHPFREDVHGAVSLCLCQRVNKRDEQSCSLVSGGGSSRFIGQLVGGNISMFYHLKKRSSPL